jgi:hypothetical protein
MGQVQDIQDAEDQGVPDREKPVDASDEKAVDQLLND